MSSQQFTTLRQRLEAASPQELYHVEWVLHYLRDNEKSEQDKSNLAHFLTANVARRPTVFRDAIDDDGMDERLELLLILHDNLRASDELYTNDLQAFAWAQAFLSVLSNPVLRSLRDNQARLLQVCASVRPFTTGINKGTGLGRDPNQGADVPRNTATPDATKGRDGWCILSFKRGILHACHIIAYGATKSQWALNMLRQQWCVAECLFADDPELLEFLQSRIFNEPGSIDVPTNMITLNSYLHAHWDDAFFGLKVLGLGGAFSVQVQYVQFYTTDTRRARRRVTARDLVEIPEESESQRRFDGFFEYNGQTGHRIQDGDLFSIKCATFVDALHMSYLLKLRWAASRLQFLAGAAGVHLDEDDEEDWTEPDYLESRGRYADLES